MKELVRTNNPALLSFVQSLLSEAEIEFLLADQHASIMDGSIGALPRRILVPDDDFEDAKRIMREADIGDEISRTHNKD
ncbi:DUF2007 domain-containing protein [Hyphococcus luteus]|uniref:DUF2007 domain-containing protein n=1 Tax=Hyphococcus luteus TaxID=2058213 RepID=A0A2S7JZE9_9PROT|nr:DUF2007 domain-containing protein [Marinicaulis flavus]PQA85612.1 hypothetical protein CW354_22010 [Marinicaulis flavus]